MNFNEQAIISFRGVGRRQAMDIQNARLIWKNFAGKQEAYNAAGNSNFNVIIDNNSVAEQLATDGWNVKIFAPKNGDEPFYRLKVNCSFASNNPPRIYIIDENGQLPKEPLTKDQAALLDRADISHVDLTVVPYYYDKMNPDSNKKSAYLEEMYVVLNRSPFAQKYASQSVDNSLPF